MENWTWVSEFILLGLSEDPQQQKALFGLFCTLYLIGCLANLLTILAIVLNPHLHSSMYFFLSNLSLLDICFTSTTILKMLLNHLCGRTTVSASICVAQMIPHFFCDLNALISCSDTQDIKMLVLVLGGPVILVPFVCIMASYTPIAMAVLKVLSAQGKWKAFSTCGTHLCVVCLFYGTIIGVYFKPTSAHATQMDMAATVMYKIVAPMLNPFIYSLRNRDLKGVFRKLCQASLKKF
ncbi:olfactory receptor 1361 [Pteropus alecto]|uniref:olfactory receptor 1361 n=1 Tax=Pteropus alecto TaxID=9402 RepID=UPI0007686524|nr:olfactory receptor 1361 [Pteropus alecto]